LTKKIRKATINKGSSGEDSDKDSHKSEESNNRYKRKKDLFLSLMLVEQIPNIIVELVKA